MPAKPHAQHHCAEVSIIVQPPLVLAGASSSASRNAHTTERIKEPNNSQLFAKFRGAVAFHAKALMAARSTCLDLPSH